MQPAGRITRKARHFEAEIAQLRAQGYTLEAIRQALAGVDVHVSISTVRREANRNAAPNPVALTAGAAANTAAGSLPASRHLAPATNVAPVRVAHIAGMPEPISAKELAEAFVRTKSTNPLIRAKENP
jgi:uncharacterized protein HemY